MYFYSFAIIYIFDTFFKTLLHHRTKFITYCCFIILRGYKALNLLYNLLTVYISNQPDQFDLFSLYIHRYKNKHLSANTEHLTSLFPGR